MFCEYCGQKNDPSAKFCASCGATLPVQSAEQSQSAPVTDTPPGDNAGFGGGNTAPGHGQAPGYIIPDDPFSVHQQPQQPPRYGYAPPPQHGQPMYGQPPYRSEPVAAQPKKTSKVIVIIVVFASLFILGVLSSIIDRMSNQTSFTSELIEPSKVSLGNTTEQIEEWIEDNDLNDSIKVDNDTMKFQMIARNGSLVYSYQYKIDVGDESMVGDTLQNSLDNYSATYESIHSRLKREVPSAKSVIIEYLNKDGKVLASKEYISD